MLRETLGAIHRLEDLPQLTGALGFSPVWRELPAGCLGTTRAAVVGRSGEFEWYGVSGVSGGAVRRVARALAGRGLPAAVFALDQAARCVVIAAGDAPPLALALDAPDPLGLARLERCRARASELALATAFRIGEALAGRGIDDRFFAEFRRTLANVMAAMPGRIPLADCHAIALLQLTRILFLYFIETKGWLGGGGEGRVLREAVDRCLSERRSLHRDLLDPLFFGTLNRPYAVRSRLAQRFGPVPFLNGGLFEPHPLERRWRATLPTPVLRDAFDGLFERFHFTLAPSSGESIAPDMLGRVFEGVMEPGERHATGSYYTPTPLVDGVLREAFVAWLEPRLGVPPAEVERRLAEPDPLTRRVLRTIRLLDPAAGSGAFLLGALRLLAGPREPGRSRAARLRAILGTCLFGVDRNPAAVRLAELRLWLEVVAAEPGEPPFPRIAPLPNLDALVRQGDSLVDPLAGIPFGPASPGFAAELARLRALVVRTAGPDKAAAVRALRRAEQELAETALGGAIQTLDGDIAELLESGRGLTLFGERRGLSRDERVRLATLREARRRARERFRTVRRTGEVPWFHYAVHFADVLARGGFDLVVGNPPWIRAEALAATERRYLVQRFRWFRPAKAGRSGYAHLPDLAVAFLERALDLVAPDGVVALLVPAKLATAGYAAVARGELARRTTLTIAADLQRDTRASFNATVYPMALVARRSSPPAAHRVRLALGAEAGRKSVPQRELGAAPWVLVPDAVHAPLARLRTEFPLLGDRFSCQLGVKTGCNQAFLDPPASVEAELIRWAVRGRDVKSFRVRAVRRLLWPCEADGRPLPALPPGAAHHLEQFAGALRRRSDQARKPGGPLWALFRTGPASASHRVVWPDLAPRLMAAPLVGPGSRNLVPLNTCYVVPVRDAATALRLAAWLNSTWCRALAAATADPASGGFRRYNARVVSSLPCPPALLGDDLLLDLARAGLRATLLQKELDDRAATLLSLSGPERRALAGLARASAEPGGRIAGAG